MYTCDATVDTIEPTATPMTDPAMPMRADKSIDVTAASAPAASCAADSPSNSPFTDIVLFFASSVMLNLALASHCVSSSCKGRP